MFCGDTSLSVWQSEPVQVQLTMTVSESCIKIIVSGGTMLTLHIQMLQHVESGIVWASFLHRQAFVILHITDWKRQPVFNATYFCVFSLYPVIMCCCSIPVSSLWSWKLPVVYHLTHPGSCVQFKSYGFLLWSTEQKTTFTYSLYFNERGYGRFNLKELKLQHVQQFLNCEIIYYDGDWQW